MAEYRLIEEKKNAPLVWCFYVFYEGYVPENKGYSNLKGVQQNGIYIAGFDNYSQAVQYGMNEGYLAI